MRTEFKSLILVFAFAQALISPGLAKPQDIDIYKVDLNYIDNYKVIEKGTDLNLIVNKSVSSRKGKRFEEVSFRLPLRKNYSLRAKGYITEASKGSRLSKKGHLDFSTEKLYLDDGQEINFAASSPFLEARHKEHAGAGLTSFGRFVTGLAVTTSPATFGIGLGASFVVAGLLSARQNGAGDFIWGGLDGAGLSFVERMLRKQPDFKVLASTNIPFKLNSDLKISQGVVKEKSEYSDISKEEAVAKINQLLEWGDLTGAIEMAKVTNNAEIYEKLLGQISS